ncbi:MAG TPA: amidohydrolase family protein [Vicinamibacteria bacterium]|nr:amidohydrolase family protein [Vicinamibacteria bacterium]
MDTPFGDLRIVDAHAHFFSHHFFELIVKGLPDPPAADALDDFLRKKLDLDLPSEDPQELASRWVVELDRHGVARTVLIASVPGDEDSVAAAYRVAPERVIPYFMLNPKAPDARARARRAFEDLGFRGVCLFPAMHHFHVWESDLEPIFADVAERSGIVFVHFGLLKVGIRDQLGLQSPFDLRFANPLDLAVVARRHQTVPFVIPHFGCGFFRELLLLASQCPNVYADTSSSNTWMEKLPERLTLEKVFARTLEVIGPERILYGSDSSFFPRGFVKDHLLGQLDVVAKLSVSRDQAALIFGGNLERLVGRMGESGTAGNTGRE